MSLRIASAALFAVLAGGGAHAGSADRARAPVRIEPLPPEEWSPETRERLEATVRRVAGLEARAPSRPLPILTVIARHPTLLGPFLEFTGTLATRGALSRRASELLALRAAWNCRSAFEWGHHVHYAHAAGLSDQEIARVAQPGIAAEWTQSERALLAAADELHARQRISDQTWAALARSFDEAQRIEIPFIVGQYTMLSMVAESLGVPVEAELPTLPEAAR
jgi:4-carboxymuconolactone decarboxylase